MQEHKTTERKGREVHSPSSSRSAGRSRSPPKSPKSPKSGDNKPSSRRAASPSPKQAPPIAKSSSKPNVQYKNVSASPHKTKSGKQGEVLIRETINSWNSTYLFSIKHLETSEGAENKPTPTTPVPEYTANMYFLFHPADDKNKQRLSYTIESQSFVHLVGDKIAFREEWIDRVIEGKQIVQAMLA